MGRKKAKQDELPGMERRDVPEIEQAADSYRQIRDERCALSKRESEAKAALIQVMKNKGRAYYSYNGLIVQLSNQENVKVKAKDEDDDEPIGTFVGRDREIEAEERPEWASPIPPEPEQAEPSEEERERLHREAVATWRRERPASIEDEDDGGTPLPTEFDEVAMKRIASHLIGFDGLHKPVKICQVLGQPHIIVGIDSEDARVINAYPILPLQNVGEDEEARLSSGEDVYIGRRINCGSKKRPDPWVIVGPETIFKLRPAAQADDFTAPRCNECKMIDGAHTKECPNNPDRLTYEDYLGYCKTQYKTNAASYARKMELIRDPGQDEFVREWKQRQAGNSAEAEPKGKKSKRGGLTLVEQAIDR